MMNYRDAIKKINKLFGFQKFNSYKLKDSEQELVLENDLAIDEPIYIITSNGQLPAKDGEYILEDTTKIKIEDGKVREIKYDMEKKSQSFVEAKLKDGTVVKSNTFDVGEDIFVVSPDGKESPAPDGEHELALKDSEGKEVTIRVITKDGKIVERMNVEEKNPEVGEDMGMVPDLSVGNDIIDDEFKKKIMDKMESIVSKLDELTSGYEDMKAKVAKFSKEPAGQPIRQSKNVTAEYESVKGNHLEQLIKIRANAQNKNK
jgi:major membrane immunogen (membrane-anchored lipoprotein)